ncbi:MAG TPA: thermonuclease family protein [Caulobacterales bacterium]|nr:thermonuclease family protein [Caulobacterales bacterium]
MILSFGLLILALVVFFASTIQLKMAFRIALIVLGALLLVGAAVLRGPEQGVGLLTVLSDAFSSGRPFSESVLAAAMTSNAAIVEGAMTPTLNVFVVLGVLVLVVALIALTPGVWLERQLRRVMLLIFGAMGGAFFALLIVAGGLSGYPKDRLYVGRSVEVVDGDTIRMGDVSLRLYGIDAPEFLKDDSDKTQYTAHNQACWAQSRERFGCGWESWVFLSRLVDNHLVVCRPFAADGALRETFGRPIVKCELHLPGQTPVDLAQRLVAEGQADIYRDDRGRPNNTYASELAQAQQRRAGMWRGGALAPYLWRNCDAQRTRFLRTPIMSWIVRSSVSCDATVDVKPSPNDGWPQ